MLSRVRRFAIVIPLAALPLASVGHVAPILRAPNGYVVTMQFDDRSTENHFTIKVLDGRFRVEFDELLPMVGRVVNVGSGAADAISLLANMGQTIAGGYMFAGDSGKLVVVLPALNAAIAFDATAIAGGRKGMRRQAGGNDRQGFGGRNGRGGRGAPPDSAAGQRQRRGAPGPVAVDSVTVQDLGVGEKMLGHATRKYRIRVSSPIAAGGSCTSATSNAVTTDGWFATDLSDGGFTNVFSLLPLLLGGASPAAGPDPLQNAMPRGMPMKMVALCDLPGRDPVGTLKVTSVEPATLDAADFEIPAGMSVLDPAAMGRGRGRRGGG